MLNVGDYVSKIGDGVCRISQISDMAFGGKTKRSYYEMEPVAKPGSKIFVPSDAADNRVRPVMTRAEALLLIDKIPSLPPILVENEKQREQLYQQAMQSNDPAQWVKIIKTIYYRREERTAAGKKITNVDQRYFKLAEECLYAELSLVLNEDRSSVISRIEAASKSTVI